MIRVVLLTGGQFKPVREHGHIDFLRLPVDSSEDFVVSPPGVVEFEDVQKIAGDLREEKTSGSIPGYDWRRQ